MACLSVLSFLTMQTVLRSQISHSDSFVPAKRLSAAFEREVLNARIFFIYFVTIQKPGSLDKGWERYHNAESGLLELNTLAAQQDELGPLRGPIAKLGADLDAYRPALMATLKMVQDGERAGSPRYDAQVKEWAARGAVLVTDAGNVEALCSATSEASTNLMVARVKLGEVRDLESLALGFLLCIALTGFTLRKLNQLLHQDTQVATHS